MEIPDFPYSFEEFEGHLVAMKHVMLYTVVTTFEGEEEVLGKKRGADADFKRVVDYMLQNYATVPEALVKASVFNVMFMFIKSSHAKMKVDGFVKVDEHGEYEIHTAFALATHRAFTAIPHGKLIGNFPNYAEVARLARTLRKGLG